MTSKSLPLLAVALLGAGLAASPAEARSQMYSPRNDDFTSAFALPSSSLLRAGHLYYATRQLGEPKATAASAGRTVWYKYVAPATAGRAVLALTLGGMDAAPMQVAVYRGTALGSLVKLGSGGFTATGTDTATAVAFDTAAGTTYMVQVDSAAQTGYFEGNFQIGLVQYGPAGGMPLFTEQPVVVREEYSTVQRLLAVNGFKARVGVEASVTEIDKFLTITSTGGTLDVGRTSWFEVKDDYYDDLPKAGIYPGTLTLLAKNSTTGSILGRGTAPVFAIREDTVNRPKVLVRFERPAQGVRAAEPITSIARITNTSGVPAAACWFVPSGDAYALSYAEVTATGTANPNKPFSLAAGQTRTFTVNMTGTGDNYEQVEVTCGGYATRNGDYLSRMWALEQYGMAAKVLIRPVGVDAFDRLAVPDQTNGRTVVVKLTNAGEYAGDFEVNVADEAYMTRADVTAVCEATAAGVCLAPAGEYRTTINLAKGETGYVALKLNRGTDPTSGFVYLDVESIGSPMDRDAGYGGFEVMKP
jgi:hypothetical protein